MSAQAINGMESNAAVQAQILSENEAQNGQKEIKSMDHHRQMLQAKLAAEQYDSPQRDTNTEQNLTVTAGDSRTTSLPATPS